MFLAHHALLALHLDVTILNIEAEGTESKDKMCNQTVIKGDMSDVRRPIRLTQIPIVGMSTATLQSESIHVLRPLRTRKESSQCSCKFLQHGSCS